MDVKFLSDLGYGSAIARSLQRYLGFALCVWAFRFFVSLTISNNPFGGTSCLHDAWRSI